MRRAAIGTLQLALLFGCGRSRVPDERALEAATSSGSAASVSAAPIASAVPAPRTSSWSIATTLREPPHPVPKGVANVGAHVPAGLDPTRPLHLVVFFHGAFSCAAQLALSGPVECKPGEGDVGGYRFGDSHDDAGTASIFVAPQLAFRGGGIAGRMSERGYFDRFVGELVSETLREGLLGPHRVDEVESITLVSHSAGWAPLQAILRSRALETKVRNVVVLDAPFAGGAELYASWVGSPPPGVRRKLVALHGRWGDTNGTNAAIARLVRASHPEVRVAVDPPGALADAIREHDVVVANTQLDHYWMPHMLLPKVIAGLPLPARELPEDRYAWQPPPAKSLPRDVDVHDALDGSDGRLTSGAIVDRWTLTLAEGESVTLVARGERSPNEFCCNVDLALELLDTLDGLRVLARDDDGAGGFDPRLVWRAPRAGTYVVRVRSSGSFYRAGGYVLRASSAGPAAGERP